MYFFATGSCITELESNGQDVDGADGVIPYKLPEYDSASYAYAAEDKHRGRLSENLIRKANNWIEHFTFALYS